MGFSSLDDFLSEVTVNGKFRRADWNKNVLPITTQVAGTWYSLGTGAGNPPAASLLGSGTNLSFQPGWHDVTPNAGAIQHGGDVSPDTKHILNVSGFSAAATSMPAVLMLVDVFRVRFRESRPVQSVSMENAATRKLYHDSAAYAG